MNDHLFLDFESRSEVDLTVRGLHNYITDPSTSVLMLAYALNKEEPKLWQPHLAPFPVELEEILDSPFVIKVAWNASFERHVFKYLLNRDIPHSEWRDPSIWAKHVSMPGYLEDVSEIMGLEGDAKLKWGTKENIGEAQRLIQMFCQPVCEARESLFGQERAVFRNWDTDPADWQKMCDYCLKDVLAERAILRKLLKYPLPDTEQRGWETDQVINERGICIDSQLVDNCLHIADQAKYTLDLRSKKITGLDNPNSRDQLLAWAKTQGYPYNSLGKVWVQRALNGTEISKDCREAFLLRQQSSKTSWTKFQAIKQAVSSDGRVRHQFSYLGAARTGRWAGHEVQMQNLPKGSKELEKKFDLALQLVRDGRYDEVKKHFNNEMDVVSGLVRPAFVAAPGKKLLISDANAIENRGIGWICKCKKILDVFRKGLCPYKDFATKMFEDPYNSITKDQRQTAKPAVLGAGYRLSGGEESEDKFGNPIKTGLWGYCTNYGVEMTQEQAHYAVKIFRQEYKDVVNFWYALEDASHAAVLGAGPQTIGPLTFEMRDKILMMHLPSGRRLHYIDAHIEDREFFGKMKPTLIYKGKNQTTKQWCDISTHGGHLLENGTQAICRDFLLNAMMEAEKRGLPIVLHCHDELVAEVDIDGPFEINDLNKCLEICPKWAPGFPLKAEGFESQYYRKG